MEAVFDWEGGVRRLRCYYKAQASSCSRSPVLAARLHLWRWVKSVEISQLTKLPYADVLGFPI